jgi:integrase
MSSITALGPKSSRRYRARWRTADGGSRTRTFDRKLDAERFLNELDNQRHKGVTIDLDRGKRTFESYAESWLASKVDIRPRTRINIEGRLRNHVLPTFARRPLAAIGPEDVREWVKTLVEDKQLAPATVKAAYLVIAQVMATAEIDRIIARTPCIGIRLPRDVGGEEPKFLTPDQVATLAEAITPRFRAVVLTAAYCGLRAGELSALRTERVSFLRSRISVVEAISEVRGKLVVGPTKTGATRDVPMPRFLVAELAEHVRQYPTDDGYLFSMAEGGPVRHRNFYRRHFLPAVDAAGLTTGLRFHDLRHTAAALLIDRGASPKQVQAILGHSTIRVTFDRYGHLFEGHANDLMDALDMMHAEARVSPACHGGVMALARDSREP